MSELKFRAFDTENKTWTFVTLGDLICGACTENGDKPLSGAKQVWEQYTGLKDKNGKEIYEGDIVREEIDTGLEDIDGEYEYIVQWSDDFKEFTIQTTSKNKIFFHDELYQLNMSREIIGNIHENTELLEGEE